MIGVEYEYTERRHVPAGSHESYRWKLPMRWTRVDFRPWNVPLRGLLDDGNGFRGRANASTVFQMPRLPLDPGSGVAC